MIRPQVVLWTAFLVGIVMSSTVLAVPDLSAPSSHQGKVNGVGKAEIMVTDSKDGEIETFKVDDSTKITVDGKPARLVDIQVGFVAEITAEMSRDGKLTAKTINASSRLGPKHAVVITSALE